MNFFSHRAGRFFPLTLTMPLQDILFGMNTLGEKWKTSLPDSKPLWIEPTVLPDKNLIRAIRDLEEGGLLTGQNDQILACRPDPSQISLIRKGQLPEKRALFKVIPYPGEIRQVGSLQYLIENNKSQITEDWNRGTAEGKITSDPAFSQTYIHPSAKAGTAVIDDTDGPVFIGPGVTILPGARIKGPVVFLEGCLVKMSSELYPGSTFGRHTTLNGEIKNVIIHDFSAKGHEGYLGDSILGRWNNLGAGTTVSNLKHTFSNIIMKNWITGIPEDLGSLKRGLITGDFVRLGILSKVGNGTAIGSFTSIATEGTISGNIPQLTWWTGDQKSVYKKDKAQLHALRQMKMKGYSWDDQWEEALDLLNTSPL